MRKYLSNLDISFIADELKKDNKFISSLATEWNPLPENFQRCSYIESFGSEYIQTECVLDGNSEVIIDFEFTSLETPSPIFGCRIDVTENAFGIWGQNTPDQNHKESDQPMVGIFPQYGPITYMANPIFMDPMQRLRIHMAPSFCIANTNKIEYEKKEFSTQSRLTILNMNSSEVPDTRRVIGKLYGCRVYENGLLSLFLIPVVKKDSGEAGMFDIVSQSFFGNSGEGLFIAG